MSSDFDLTISTSANTANFCLRDAAGNLLATNQVELSALALSEQIGLFNLQVYLSHYIPQDDDAQAQAVAEVGVWIAEKLLGKPIFDVLWRADSQQRSLRIALPGAAQPENDYCAALARVPWEMARPSITGATLEENNLLIRVVHDMAAPASQPLQLPVGEALRVLFVFAGAKGSQPLGARKERNKIKRLFEEKIAPERHVVLHLLSHGVTRTRLRAQIERNGGYHIVHWSGHGACDTLELALPSGAEDNISGAELAELFKEAGGFLPRLVFLSACNSGVIGGVVGGANDASGGISDMDQFLAVAEGRHPARAKPSAAKALDLEQRPGFTGTAHTLLQAGVPAVVAMRYSVGDDYARELALEFYEALLAHELPKSSAAALSFARRALQRESCCESANESAFEVSLYSPSDHATPILYGENQPSPAPKATAGVKEAPPATGQRLHHISELTTAHHASFAGRTWELAGLGAHFIGGLDSTHSTRQAQAQPVALITGLGGMGKTALCAEVLDLWQNHFTWVLLYQAKPNPLQFEATLRDIHAKLKGELQAYHQHVQKNPADAIYRDADDDFTGRVRLQRLTRNLARAMRAESIFLVLDNFEGNLQPDPITAPGGAPLWESQDDAWDACLTHLAQELPGSRSRLLLTCRRPLVALAQAGAAAATHTVPLGPLAVGEAALYLREHAVLSRMLFGGDGKEKALARRLLLASRFHPLLMDRLARLADGKALRPQLLQALSVLETQTDLAQLSALFAALPGDVQQLAYLEGALAVSLDQLIAHSSADARRVLWLVAVANEPVLRDLLAAVWQGAESESLQEKRQIKQMLEMLSQLPHDVQEQLKNLPPEVLAQLQALPPATGSNVDIVPLLHHLSSVGLATQEQSGPDAANPEISCHELVRERIRVWMAQNEGDRAKWTENAIRLAYADLLSGYFSATRHKDMAAALVAGSRAIVYCVQAGDYARLGGFASSIVTAKGDPYLLQGLLPHLQSAAAAAPQGRAQWCCLGLLADALREGGQPDASLPFYRQAIAQARSTALAGGGDATQAWSDLGRFYSNTAVAYTQTAQLAAARQHYLASAAAQKQAGRGASEITGMELEALRIDIKRGRALQALPLAEERLEQMAAWWQRQRAGQPVPEAPGMEDLARTYISVLDIARQADCALKEWHSALRRIDAILEVKRELHRPPENIAGTRVNRANVLGQLQCFNEARSELETCFRLLQHNPARRAGVLNSLASLFADQNDIDQAILQQRRALALHEDLPDPAARAISHNNLAAYLGRSGIAPAQVEARWHKLAALAYRVASKLGQDLQTSLRNYAIEFHHARAAATELFIPTLADLLVRDEFDPLKRWLQQREITSAALQADIDDILAQVRQQAFADDAPKP